VTLTRRAEADELRVPIAVAFGVLIVVPELIVVYHCESETAWAAVGMRRSPPAVEKP
jgi:hypothetical protein